MQYFCTIATYSSIAQASKFMHITPQTLSAQINLLKVQLGY
ncbi:helix-turn-helix domain-containing protein [Shewanella sp. A14]